MNPDKSQSC